MLLSGIHSVAWDVLDAILSTFYSALCIMCPLRYASRNCMACFQSFQEPLVTGYGVVRC